MLLINAIPVFFLGILNLIGKIKGNPLVVFGKGILFDIVLFVFASIIIAINIEPSVTILLAFMIILQLLYFPIFGLVLLLQSVSVDINWTKKNWKEILPIFIVLLFLLGVSILGFYCLP